MLGLSLQRLCALPLEPAEAVKAGAASPSGTGTAPAVNAAAGAAAGRGSLLRRRPPAACNPDAGLGAADELPGFSHPSLTKRAPPSPLITLPQPAGQEAEWPAALDGSPYAFYFGASPTKVLSSFPSPRATHGNPGTKPHTFVASTSAGARGDKHMVCVW